MKLSCECGLFCDGTRRVYRFSIRGDDGSIFHHDVEGGCECEAEARARALFGNERILRYRIIGEIIPGETYLAYLDSLIADAE